MLSAARVSWPRKFECPLRENPRASLCSAMAIACARCHARMCLKSCMLKSVTHDTTVSITISSHACPFGLLMSGTSMLKPRCWTRFHARDVLQSARSEQRSEHSHLTTVSRPSSFSAFLSTHPTQDVCHASSNLDTQRCLRTRRLGNERLSPAPTADSAATPRDWLIGVSAGVPGYEREPVPELFTIGLNVSQTTPGRLGADFSIGTMPRALIARAAVLGARAGVGPSDSADA